MTLLGALRLGRAQAEARMTQTWQIGTLVEGEDPVTFDPLHELEVQYDGPGRLKVVQATTVSEREAASQLATVTALELHLPAGTTGVETDMRAVCVACPEDPSLVGFVVRVKGPGTRGQVTAFRVPVEASGEVLPVGS